MGSVEQVFLCICTLSHGSLYICILNASRGKGKVFNFPKSELTTRTLHCTRRDIKGELEINIYMDFLFEASNVECYWELKKKKEHSFLGPGNNFKNHIYISTILRYCWYRYLIFSLQSYITYDGNGKHMKLNSEDICECEQLKFNYR